MLSLGVVGPTSSPWANPIVCVPKSDGRWRLCLDARKLNSVTVKESYPLPYITRILGNLSGTRYLSSIDLKDAYWQVPLHPSSRPKTAFVVPGRGLFQFNVMPFGISNAAQSMSRLMDMVLGYDLEPFVFVYLDDIVVATNTMEEHFSMLKTVAERLEKAGLTINVSKSKFCVKSLKYLGFIIDEKGLHTDPDKVKAILEFPTPTCTKDVRRILGMSGWYRRFIKDFATITSPLTDLLKKGNKKFNWNPQAEKAFNELKEKLTSAPVLANADYGKRFTIQCDASDSGVGAIISQNFDGEERVISYMSQKLTSTQKKYSVTEKECLAVILAVEKFRWYVGGVKFIIITDHSSLQWLDSMKNPSGRLWRWTMRLQMYHYDIIHRKGSAHIVPDALSRAAIDCLEACIVEGLTEEPDWYRNLLSTIKKDGDNHPDYKIVDDKLYKHCVSRKKYGWKKAKWKRVVPPEERNILYKLYHDNPLAGHLGYHKTLSRITSDYYWPGIAFDIQNYVRQCEICKAAKPNTKKNRAPLGKPKQADSPWELVSLDFVGPFPRSKEGNTMILVICDWFSKFVIARAIRNANAKTLTKILERDVFLTFGVPKILWSDNGKQIVSKMMDDLLKKYKVKHIKTALYSPQSNHTERVNKVITSSIRAYINKDHREWDKHLQQIVTAINTVPHDSTKYSPYFINFGQEMKLSGENPLGEIGDEQAKRTSDWENNVKVIRKEVQENIQKAYLKQKKYYDVGTSEVSFTPGEIVWRTNFQLSDASNAIASKLLPKNIKCKIVAGKGSNYEVEDCETKKHGIYQVKDLFRKEQIQK